MLALSFGPIGSKGEKSQDCLISVLFKVFAHTTQYEHLYADFHLNVYNITHTNMYPPTPRLPYDRSGNIHRGELASRLILSHSPLGGDYCYLCKHSMLSIILKPWIGSGLL